MMKAKRHSPKLIGGVWASHTKIYGIWYGMKSRCENQNHSSYTNYGGRGIKVCERWNDFWNFYEDMGERPQGMWLERIDNNGNYDPSNCKWATVSEQRFNTRLQKNNISGVRGVGWYAPRNKWRARLCRKTLGYFDSLQEATDAYQKAYHVR